MLKRNLVRTSIAAIAVLLLATTVSATTIQKLSDRQMVNAADLVVVGKCVQMKSEWIGRNLVTRYTFQVNEVWSGSAATQVDVIVPGGADASRKFPVATVYPGAPIFMPNEQAVLLLSEINELAAGNFSVVGFNQGRFTVGIPAVQSAPGIAASAAQVQPRDGISVQSLRSRFSSLISEKESK